MKNLYFITNYNWKFLFFLCMALCATTISAQVHIGPKSEPLRPPHESAMLEISADDKGVLFPSVALTADNDTSIMVNQTAVDGLIVFNTTEDPSKNLYKGLYAWNSVNHLWENIATDNSFRSALPSHFATEETYFLANVLGDLANPDADGQKIADGKLNTSNTSNQLTFNKDSYISINKENCFSNNIFTVPKSGYYKIACGVEFRVNPLSLSNSTSDYATLQLLSRSLNGSDEKVIISVKVDHSIIPDAKTSGDLIYMPLTPSVIYNGYLEQGKQITANVNIRFNAGSQYDLSSGTSVPQRKGYLIRKYLYINTF